MEQKYITGSLVLNALSQKPYILKFELLKHYKTLPKKRFRRMILVEAVIPFLYSFASLLIF